MFFPSSIPCMKSVDSPPTLNTTLSGHCLRRASKGPGRLGQVRDGLVLALVPQQRREPDLEPLLERGSRGGHDPTDVQGADVDRVAVKVLLDYLELAPDDLGVEDRAPVEPHECSDVVADSLEPHPHRPLLVGRVVRGHRPEGFLRLPRQIRICHPVLARRT